jgi:triosephosphate isomerase
MNKGNKKLILGNWKMNPQSREEALKLAEGIVSYLPEDKLKKVDVGIAPPFVFLDLVSGVIKEKSILLGSQDVFWRDKGAYTGEISADELKSTGVNFVIVGHSERRKMGETDEEINKKIKKSLEEGLLVVLCVGEGKEIRDKGIDAVKSFISNELETDLEGTEIFLEERPDNLVAAYEPLWAISNEENSRPASSEEAVETISFIKDFLEKKGFEKNKVLYGGSVSGKNSNEFLENKNISGLLIGGASLNLKEFQKIIDSAFLCYH